MKGKFGLVYIEDEKIYPAYLKGKENKELLNTVIKGGMFGDKIIIDKDKQIGITEGGIK